MASHAPAATQIFKSKVLTAAYQYSYNVYVLGSERLAVWLEYDPAVAAGYPSIRFLWYVSANGAFLTDNPSSPFESVILTGATLSREEYAISNDDATTSKYRRVVYVDVPAGAYSLLLGAIETGDTGNPGTLNAWLSAEQLS